MTEVPRQKYLSNKALIVFIGYISAFIPMSTDVYLPALPHMAKNFNAQTGLVNLTVMLFFVFHAVSSLFWGPLSDRHGRKPVLMVGLFIYITASILCATSTNIYKLIAFRIIQAVGSGSVTTMGLAMIKDVYDSKKRTFVLAITQSLVMILPIVAPIIGAFILTFLTWRGVFWALALAGLLAVAGGLLLQETLGEENSGGLKHPKNGDELKHSKNSAGHMHPENNGGPMHPKNSRGLRHLRNNGELKHLKNGAGQKHPLGRLGAVLRNKDFTILLVTFFMARIPMMAYISISSYIYQNDFGLNEQAFSVYFAANSLFAAAGSLLYIRIAKKFSNISIISAYLCVMIAGSLFMLLIGSMYAWVFLLCIIPTTVAINVIQPLSVNILLEKGKDNAGAVSSLIDFSRTFFGSIGMIIISLGWANRILALGTLYALCTFFSIILWQLISKRLVYKLQ